MEELQAANEELFHRRLSTRLFEAYGAAERIALQLEANAVRPAVNTAIPCGLILNELLSNALKYAFPDGRAGEIHIALRHTSDGTYVLMVRDTGVGCPEGLDFRHTDSLGWQLICVNRATRREHCSGARWRYRRDGHLSPARGRARRGHGRQELGQLTTK